MSTFARGSAENFKGWVWLLVALVVALSASELSAAWSETRCAAKALRAAEGFSRCALRGAGRGVRRDQDPDYAKCQRRLERRYEKIERNCDTMPPFPSESEIARLFQSAADTVAGASIAGVGMRGPSPICSSSSGFCTRVDPTLGTLSPRQIAQIWLEATSGMSGAHGGAGGEDSCVAAVSIALMECDKSGGFSSATWHGIDTPICSVKGSGASGIWQVTSNDAADLKKSGCESERAACAAGDPCCNARLAYAHAELKCTAAEYDSGACTVNGNAVSQIPQCSQVSTPNMPCYLGPFCLNTQLDAANRPYGPPTKAKGECSGFAGLDSCKRPEENWGGWGAPYDYYHNTFCCLDGRCGAEDPNNVNWSCFNHGQTVDAYACGVMNTQALQGAPDAGAPGSMQSTRTSGELAKIACDAVLAHPPIEVSSSFAACWFTPGFGADFSSSCVPEASTPTNPAAGCGPGQSLLCQNPWSTEPKPWGCEPGAPTPGSQGLTRLCGPAASKTRDTPWLWNKSRNSCVLRGGDYPLLSYTGCGNSKYKQGLDAGSYLSLQEQWQKHAREQATAEPLPTGETAYLVDIPLDGKQQKAAMALGHGAMTGLCGDCFLIRSDPSLWGGETRYAVLLQADVRAWSFEISLGAQDYLFQNTNCTGNATTSQSCCIPDVQPIDCSVVLGNGGP